MEITIGKPAPDFTLYSDQNKSVSLSDYKGKWVVVYFYPKDDTPGCTREAIGFTEQKKAFDSKNVVVLGISKDSVTSHQKFCDKYQLQIPLLSDTDQLAINAYGVWKEKKQYGKSYWGISRSTFLIDPDGCLYKKWENVKVDGHVEAVLSAIPELSC